jgi:hypothetical protein
VVTAAGYVRSRPDGPVSARRSQNFTEAFWRLSRPAAH